MMNFVLGAVAGALIACIATISAARNPEVQGRLGLFPPAPVSLMAISPRPDPVCPPVVSAGPSIGTQDMLFNKRRFWSVVP